LHIDPHLISYFLHATLKNVRDTELLRDLSEIGRSALICRVEVREITFKSAILDKRVRIRPEYRQQNTHLLYPPLRFSNGALQCF